MVNMTKAELKDLLQLVLEDALLEGDWIEPDQASITEWLEVWLDENDDVLRDYEVVEEDLETEE